MHLLFRTAIMFMACGCISLPSQQQSTKIKPTAHVRKLLHGFGINVDTRLTSGDDAALGALALERLDCQLGAVCLLVVPDRLAHLRHAC